MAVLVALGAAAALAGAGFATESFARVVLAADAFAAVLAGFSGIALLLFLVDLAAEAFAAARISFTGAQARPLETLRRPAGGFFFLLESPFLPPFCGTPSARASHAPLLRSGD